MAQGDLVVANATGLAFRQDLNAQLLALGTLQSGPSAPSTTYAYMLWADTTAGQLKIRNAANDGWVVLQQLDGSLSMQDGSAATPGLAFASDTNTGIFRPGADQFGIATGGVENVEFGTSEVVFNDGGADIDFRIEGDTKTKLLWVDAGNDAVGTDGEWRYYDADASNYVAFKAPATVSSNVTWTLPSADGTTEQSLVTDGSGTFSFASRSRLVLSTAVASTSGTSIDFTGIPSWVKRVTVMFFDVSTNGSDYLLVQLGTSGGMATDANYFSMTGANTTSNTASAVNYTTGFGIQSGNASNTLQGQYTFVNVTGNTWIASGTFTGNTSSIIYAAGRRTLSDTLTQLRITSTGGTNTFDAGTINILYEG